MKLPVFSEVVGVISFHSNVSVSGIVISGIVPFIKTFQRVADILIDVFLTLLAEEGTDTV